MAIGLRLCWCLLFAFAIISSARTTISFSVSGEEVVEWEMQGRYLKVNLDDYSGASANKGHNPPRTSVKKSPGHQ